MVDNGRDFSEDWTRLLSSARRKPSKNEGNDSAGSDGYRDHRTDAERDHDRIIFSTPVRRLADKTQVFPLEPNDSVRTRLTHSMEVSNLSRSIGIALTSGYGIAAGVTNADRNIPAILAAVGLAHDLGNPPFGHQGESAIGAWFSANEKAIKDRSWNGRNDLFQDFVHFEGNAQTIRLVTRHQLLDNEYGLDLTYGTLGALLKYTVPVGRVKQPKKVAANKKHGFHASEQEIAEDVLKHVGLAVGQRHPLAYVMEACDDIAYSVLDVEDAVKKGLLSFADVCEYLAREAAGDKVIKQVVDRARDKHRAYRDRNRELTPRELGDISMQRLRVFAIGDMVSAVTSEFVNRQATLVAGTEEASLMDASPAGPLCETLKSLALTYAYRTRSVLEVELRGYNVLHRLMDMLWYGIITRQNDEAQSDRTTPFAKYVYSRISENYRRVFEDRENKSSLPVAYRECQLLSDMVAGMTDGFALSLYEELKAFEGVDYVDERK